MFFKYKWFLCEMMLLIDHITVEPAWLTRRLALFIIDVDAAPKILMLALLICRLSEIFEIMHDDNLYKALHVHTSVDDLASCSRSLESENINTVVFSHISMWVGWAFAFLLIS